MQNELVKPVLVSEAPANPAPDWLTDFYCSPDQRGFYLSGDGYGIVFTDRGTSQLMVSYDNLASLKENSTNRVPWGYDFVAKNGWSQLGVMTFRPDWFRNGSLIDELMALAQDGFFRRFDNVAMSGTSMGAYAACAFAPLAPGCTVIALSPQSTLDPKIVPWERRFPSGRAADWSGPFADAVEGVSEARSAYLVYDPRRSDDAAHISRFSGPNVTLLQLPCAGHKTALFLRRAGILSRFISQTVQGKMTEHRFRQMARSGRRLPWYLNSVRDRLIEEERLHLLPRYIRAMRSMGFPGIAAATQKQLSELGADDEVTL